MSEYNFGPIAHVLLRQLIRTVVPGNIPKGAATHQAVMAWLCITRC